MIMTMVETGDTIIYVVGVATIFGALSSVSIFRTYLEKKVTAETASTMRDQAHSTASMTRRLSLTTEQLLYHVLRVEEIEATLKMIHETKNHNIERLKEQVDMNERLCRERKKNVKTIVLQSLLTVIIRNDKDGNFQIEGNEIDKVCADLQELIEPIDGVTFYEERFRLALLATNGSIKKMMLIIKKMVLENVFEEECNDVKHLKGTEQICLKSKIFDFGDPTASDVVEHEESRDGSSQP